MEGQYFVYRHIRLDTNVPFYIGIGKKPKEYATHTYEYYRAFVEQGRSKYWKAIVKKAGYKVEILWKSDSREEVKAKEIEFIALYGKKKEGGTLCNFTSGGDGLNGFNHTAESKRKIGLSNSKPNGRKGIPRTKEEREAISKGKKGKPLSEEHKKNLRKPKINRSYEEYCNQRRNQGKYYLDLLTGIYYPSLIDACEANNYPYQNATDYIKNESKRIRFIRAYDKIQREFTDNQYLKKS
jgi:hypothetical protein